jgi:hypothetical protein
MRFLTLSLLLITTLCSCASTAPTTTYRSPELGITLEYPSTWVLDPAKAGESIEWEVPKAPASFAEMEHAKKTTKDVLSFFLTSVRPAGESPVPAHVGVIAVRGVLVPHHMWEKIDLDEILREKMEEREARSESAGRRINRYPLPHHPSVRHFVSPVFALAPFEGYHYIYWHQPYIVHIESCSIDQPESVRELKGILGTIRIDDANARSTSGERRQQAGGVGPLRAAIRQETTPASR